MAIDIHDPRFFPDEAVRWTPVLLEKMIRYEEIFNMWRVLLASYNDKREDPQEEVEFVAEGGDLATWDSISGEPEFSEWASRVRWMVKTGAIATGTAFREVHIRNPTFWKKKGAYDKNVGRMATALHRKHLQDLLAPLWGSASLRTYDNQPLVAMEGGTAHTAINGEPFFNGTSFASAGASEDLSPFDCLRLCEIADLHFKNLKAFGVAGVKDSGEPHQLNVIYRNDSARAAWSRFKDLDKIELDSGKHVGNKFQGIELWSITRFDGVSAADDMTHQFIPSGLEDGEHPCAYVPWKDPDLEAWKDRDKKLYKTTSERGYGVGVHNPMGIFEIRSAGAPPVGPVN